MEENWTAGRDKGGTPTDLLGGMDRTTLLDKSELNDGWPGGLDDGCATGWERRVGERWTTVACLVGRQLRCWLGGRELDCWAGEGGRRLPCCMREDYAVGWDRGGRHLRCWMEEVDDSCPGWWTTAALLPGGRIVGQRLRCWVGKKTLDNSTHDR